MNVEAYEPLVKELCQNIRNPHLRSEAEQEARIRLWRFGHLVDAAESPDRMANTQIQRGRREAFRGTTWTGVTQGCVHGNANRRPDGECRICRAERARAPVVCNLCGQSIVKNSLKRHQRRSTCERKRAVR